MDKKISVVVPIYNVEQYLRRCVDSIIGQTYKDLEIILVNDGSTDGSLNICREYEKADSRIKVIDKQNGGLSSARNAGIDIMTGKYVVFIDSDDYIAYNMVERLYSIAVAEKVNIVCCRFFKFNDETTGFKADKTQPIKLLTGKEAMYQMFFSGGIGWSAWNKIYLSKLFDTIRYKEGVYMEDMSTTYLLYEQCERVAFTSEKLYYYYIRSTGITGTKSSKRAADAVNNIETIAAYYAEHYPEFKDAPLAYFAKIAPNFLATLNVVGEYPEVQEKCFDAIINYGRLAMKAPFVKSKYKLVILFFRILLSLCGKKVLKKKWFKMMCNLMSKGLK